jgi:negative regulator of flagellin synthesis FlgM
MPSIELNKLQAITGAAALTGADRAAAREPSRPTTNTEGAGVRDAGVAIEVGATISEGPPVDSDRVAEVRDALRNGSYPMVPAKIADAIIAAQYSYEIGS